MKDDNTATIISQVWFAPPPIKNPRKIDLKINKNQPRFLMYTPGIEKKLYMCPPGIEFLTPVAT